VRGGEVTRGIVEVNPELEALAMRLAQGVGCIGPVTLQFRSPAPGRWVAMELNARMGGGLPLSIAAGAEWPKWILELCAGKRIEMERPIVDGLILSRCDRSMFIPPKDALPPVWNGGALPELLIFDLDDTLYAERDFVRSGHRAVARAVWRDHRVDIEAELVRRFSLGQRGDIFTAALRTLNVRVAPDYVEEVLVPAYREHVPEIHAYVGVSDVLARLKSAGHRTALLSDGWAAVQKRKLAALGLAGLFDETVFTDDLGRDAWKPATRGFELLLARQNVTAANAAYIADNPTKDFVAPRRLGMHSFRVVRAGTEHANVIARPRSQDAAWRIDTLADLFVGAPAAAGARRDSPR